MTFYPKGMAHRLCLAALLMVGAPLIAQSESLGDVARQLRAERQQAGTHPKVWTNDDLGVPEAGNAPQADEHAKKTDEPGKGEEAASGAADEAKSGAPAAKKISGSSEQKEAEINKPYLERIAAVREKISAAQQEIARLQRDQIESSNQYRGTSGTSVSVSEFQAQQQKIQQQIADQQKLIGDLNQQLDDAREAARHAGVPHATDY
jgi:uncharacterized protein YukE